MNHHAPSHCENHLLITSPDFSKLKYKKEVGLLAAPPELGKVNPRKENNKKTGETLCCSKEDHQQLSSPPNIEHSSRALKDTFDQELIDAVEQAHKDRIDAMVTKWRIKQKLIKAMEELEACQKRQNMREAKHQQELSAYEEKQKAVQTKHEEQMQFFLFECLAAMDKTATSEIGPVNYAIKERGSRLGDYKLGKVLGTGNFSQVHVGTHLKTKKRFAIKKLQKRNITQLSELQRVQLEIHVLRNASHPNIVALHDVIHAPKTISLVMEQGCQDLQQYCEQKVHDDDMASFPIKEVVLGILKPLVHLHSMGIAHMDLKPENIVITENVDPSSLSQKHIKLCDFGLCAKAPTLDVSKEVPIHGWWGGTAGFFAPEMILQSNEGTSFEGRRADMWSLGCVILELSQEGFPGSIWMESYRMFQEDTVGFEQGLLKALDVIHGANYFLDKSHGDLVTSLLVMEPTERLTASDALTHHWFLEEGQESVLETDYMSCFIENDIQDTKAEPQNTARLVAASPDKRPRTL